MKPALIALSATIALALGGCGLEGARPSIWLQNNSELTVTLQIDTGNGLLFPVTAKPHTTEKSSGSPAKGQCLTDWEIVDQNGTLLKKVAQVCAYDTVVYP
jgi:hypothetical protein